MSESEKPTGQHVRINQTLISFLERPALKFLSSHAPLWVTPDLMTGLGTVASILIFFSYVMVGRDFKAGQDNLLHNWWLIIAALGFFINWVGDSLDGTIARYRHIERPRFGFFLDHAIDGLSAVLMFIGIGLSGMGSLQIATFALVGYLLAMINVYLKTYVTGVFVMSNIGLGPTEIRIIAIAVNLFYFFKGQVYLNPKTFPGMYLPEHTTLMTLILGFLAFLLGVYYVVQSFLDAKSLSHVDEKARAQKIAEREKEQRRLLKQADAKARMNKSMSAAEDSQQAG
ncbi:MAG: CDP-alcohol phosphatidyltransferase family protein [Anaerolineaceae bacterium]|nr:CDP-alcohol phosphatidyltransferase family protein [Anaerolineaceae bacterium]